MHRFPGHVYIHSERKSWFYGLGSQNNVLFLWLKCFLETRLSSESLDPLIGFSTIACLEPKLWLTNQKLDIIQIPQKVTLVILAKSHNSPAD